MMFRKLVSNLSFSPALVGQLGFYARRLRKEETTRRVGLVFTALALIVQSLAVFSPPEAANAASAADFIPGGVSSKQELLTHFDKNTNNIRDILASLGIKRSEVAGTSQKPVGEAGRYNWSLTSLYSYSQGQRSWNYGKGTVYYRPMTLTQGGPNHVVFAGYSEAFGWFALKKDCGNLVTTKPPQAPNPEAFCQSLKIQQLTPKRFRMNGAAVKKDGAVIKAYKYEIKRSGTGALVDTKKFDTASQSHDFVYEQNSPGKYNVRLTVITSEGQKTSNDCYDSFVVDEKPAAVCVEAKAEIINRTTVSLSGKASTANGAKITKYVFVVKNSSGKEVKRVVVKSSKRSVTADNFVLSEGQYVVTLSVHTSVGVKTDPTCAKPFTIVPNQVCPYNPSLPPNSPDCQPCPDNPDIWIKDERCDSDVISTKSSVNMSQGNVNATTVTARAGDRISYTLTVENKGLLFEKVTMSEDLNDVLEYAELIDAGGGSFNKDTKVLTWPQVTLSAFQKESRTIVIRMFDTIPTTNRGTSNQDSYDCRMVNTFGNSIDVDVECATEKKVVEQITKELPQTGPRENMIFAAALLAVVVYFYARSRQLGKEVRLIRRNLNTGTI